MASDLGVLLPTESQYGNPGAYTEAIRAEATKQAAYLSSMDQFYAQLDESRRQFDLNYAAREKEFSWTSQFEEKKLATETALSERSLGIQERKAELEGQLLQKQIEYQNAQLGFQREQLAMEAQKLQAQIRQIESQTRLGEESLSLQRELGLGELQFKGQQLASQNQYQVGQLRLGQQQVELGQQQVELGRQQLMAETSLAYTKLAADNPRSPVATTINQYSGTIGERNYRRDMASLNNYSVYAPNFAKYSSY